MKKLLYFLDMFQILMSVSSRAGLHVVLVKSVRIPVAVTAVGTAVNEDIERIPRAFVGVSMQLTV